MGTCPCYVEKPKKITKNNNIGKTGKGETQTKNENLEKPNDDKPTNNEVKEGNINQNNDNNGNNKNESEKATIDKEVKSDNSPNNNLKAKTEDKFSNNNNDLNKKENPIKVKQDKIENIPELNNNLENLKEEPKIGNEFLENSMLLHIIPDAYNTINKDPPSTTEPELLINNYIEKCYINDEYDIYEKSYEYKAIRLPRREHFDIEEIPLIKDRIIKILEFKIDDNNIKYNFDEKNSKKIKIRYYKD